MFVRQAPGKVGEGVLSYDLYLLLLWLHYAYAMLLMAGINHSTAEHSAAQHNTNINFPSAHNKYSSLLLCCSAVAVFRVPYFALSTVLLFRLCCSVLNTLHICCASSGANAFAWQKAKHFFKHFSFAFHVQLFQFSHRKCFDKYAQLEF